MILLFCTSLGNGKSLEEHMNYENLEKKITNDLYEDAGVGKDVKDEN